MNRMKIYLTVLTLLVLLCSGCARRQSGEASVIAATTSPVYQFAAAVCEGTDLRVEQVITAKISCLHDYTLTVEQMEHLAQADVVLLSGVNLEAFMADALAGSHTVIECGQGISLLSNSEGTDPHIWLDPDNAAIMTENIANELSRLYPEHEELFAANAAAYCERLQELKQYGLDTLAGLPCRELITFHDGFGYFADAFDLTILASVEEEDGATASADTLEHIISLVKEHQLPAIFTETNGSDSAASVIASETGAAIYTLDMAMSGGDDYFTAMRHNIDTVREALG